MTRRMIHIHPEAVPGITPSALHQSTNKTSSSSSEKTFGIRQQSTWSLKDRVSRRLGRIFSSRSRSSSSSSSANRTSSSHDSVGSHTTLSSSPPRPIHQSFLSTTLTNLSSDFERMNVRNGGDDDTDNAKSDATSFDDTDDDDDDEPICPQVAIAVTLPPSTMAAASVARSKRYQARAARVTTAQPRVRLATKMTSLY